MECKHCGAVMEDGLPRCPECGAARAGAPDETPEPAGTDILTDEALSLGGEASETGAEALEIEEAHSGIDGEETAEAPAEKETPPAEAAEAPKRSWWLPAALVAVAAVVVAALVLTLGDFSFNGADEDPTSIQYLDEDGNFIEHTFTVADDQLTDGMAGQVVAKSAGQELTNAELTYYYWQQYYNIASSYGSYLAMFLDTTKPLAEQMYDEGRSWEDMLLQAAMVSFRQTSALTEAAGKAGFQLSEDTTAYLDAFSQSMEESAAAGGYETGDEYLQSIYGPFATMEGYVEFARKTFVASDYLSTLYEEIAYTEEDVSAYYDENAETYAAEGITKDDVRMVDVRHILISPVADEDAELDETGSPVLTDENWAEAKTRAEDLLAQWQAGEATEDSFAQLATEHTEDPGSTATGGLYEDVRPGEMVQAFNDWCFDQSRQPGDTGVVETPYGYHVMYFSAYSDQFYWYVTAEEDYVNYLRQTLLDELTNEAGLSVDYDKVVLTSAGLLG